MIKKNKSLAYLITSKLEEHLLNAEFYHRNWRFALYAAINSALDLKEEDFNYKYPYKQWGIDHRMRAMKSSLDTKSPVLVRCEWIEDNLHVHCSMQEDTFTVVLSLSNFPSGLYLDKNGPNQTAILENRHESILILKSLANADDETTFDAIESKPAVEPQELQEVKKVIPTSKKATSPTTQKGYDAGVQLKKDQREKLSVYYELLNHVRPLFSTQTSEIRQSFLSTVFGAGLFYLPHGVKHWIGKISRSCLIEQITGSERKVRDHIFPRKAAANHLLTNELTNEEFETFYMEEVAPFMYVTPKENSQLINYYKNFDHYNDALQEFGIIPFPPDEHTFTSPKELNQFISFCSERKLTRSGGIDEYLDRLYEEFRLSA